MSTVQLNNGRVLQLRRELIDAGACPFSIAAMALERVERLEQQILALKSSPSAIGSNCMAGRVR